MSVDRAKVLEAAQKQLGKGNYDKAIAELRKIVKSEPDDVRTWLKIGDLYTRKGARSQAIDTYLHVAHAYGDQGFFLKAVAVYKQILKLDPTRLDVQVSLGEMYEMLHLVSDALSTYEHVAAAYARAGDIDSALDTLQKMTGLDPENIPVRIKYAEALSKAGRTKEAADEFEQGAGLLEAQGRIDDYIKVAERLLYHRADDVETARRLAGLYLERDDPKRALSKLQLCFKADPKDIQTLTLLAEAFHQLGQLPKTISVYKEVARIHHEANRSEDRATTLRKILELDPGDREARQALAQYAGGGGGGSVRRDIQPPASALIQPSQSRGAPQPDEPELIEDVEDVELLEVDPAEEEILLVEDDDAPDMEIVDVDEMEIEEIEEPAPPDDGSVSADVQREAQIARLLTECEVFMRYGLEPKVIETLEAILQIDPSQVEAHERLKEVYLQNGQSDLAIAQLLQLADVLSEEHSAAAVLYLRQILDIDPSHPEARARLESAGASVPPPRPGPVAALDATADELAPPMQPVAVVEEDEDEVFFLDEGDEELTDAGEPLTPAPVEHTIEQGPPMATTLSRTGPSTATDGAPYVDPEPDMGIPVTPDFDADPMPDLEPEPMRHAVIPPPSAETRLEPEPLPEPLPGPPRSSIPPAGVDPLAPMSPQEFEEVPLRPSTPGAAHAEANQRLSMPPGEVEESLDEADFFIAQGLLEEARAMLQDALTNHPGHPLIGEKIREIDAAAQRRAEAHQARLSQEIPIDQSFELAEKLAEEIDQSDDTQAGSDVLDVEQVFAQFKKGVEAQVGAEDTETHFDLGIAYKEMGLLDDAISEFKLCLTNSQRLCIAQTMIGLCHIEKGEIAEAISHFKKGLYAEQKTEREELGLYFELGNAYELLRDPKEALYYYQKVQKRDPTFRSIGSRIDALTKPQPASNPSALELAQDDIDAAFDDLMGED